MATELFRLEIKDIDRASRSLLLEVKAIYHGWGGVIFHDPQFILSALGSLLSPQDGNPIKTFEQVPMKSRIRPSTGQSVEYFDLPTSTENIPFDKIQVESTTNYPFRRKIKNDKDVEAYGKKIPTATIRVTFSNDAYLAGFEKGASNETAAHGIDVIDSTHRKKDFASLRRPEYRALDEEEKGREFFKSQYGVLLPGAEKSGAKTQ